MGENELMRNHMKKVNKILINTFWVGVIMHLSYVLMGVTVNKNLLRVAILVLSNLLAIALNKNERTNFKQCLTLNKNCSFIGRDFAYNLSNDLDVLTPTIHWRDFQFVTSDDKEWFRFFNKVSSSTKAIFYLCTYNNPCDWDAYSIAFDKIIKLFADEIVRCLRSDYNADDYRKRVKMAKIKTSKISNKE